MIKEQTQKRSGIIYQSVFSVMALCLQICLKVCTAVLFMISLTNCQYLMAQESGLNPSEVSLDFEQTRVALPLIPQTNYLAISLPYPPVAVTYQMIQSRVKTPLKNRGEAHITVITPPEFNALKSHITMKEINQWAQELLSQLSVSVPPPSETPSTPPSPILSDLDFLCVGRGQFDDSAKGKTLTTYFIVVQSEALLGLRKKIEKTYLLRGGTVGQFEATHFFPHITLGFTERDLHEADGVIKDEGSCVIAIQDK